MDVEHDPHGDAEGSYRPPDEGESALTPPSRVMAQFPGAAAVCTGPQHVFRAVSGALRSFIGGRDVAGLPIREALPEFDGQGLFELLDRVYATARAESVTDVPARWDANNDGIPESHVVDFTCQPLIAADGSVEGIVAFVQDVTERRAALAALAASEARYRLAVEATRLGTWTWSPATDAVSFDDRARDLLGLPDGRTAALTTVLATRVPPDDRDRLRNALARATDPAGDGHLDGEYRIVRPDANERWALIAGRVHFAEDASARHALHLVGTILDVTELKFAEARQRVLARLGGELLVPADEHVALQRLADAGVAGMADWVIVDVIDPDRSVRRVAMAHRDRALVGVMEEMSTRYPPDLARPSLGREALASGRPHLYVDRDDTLLAAMTHDAEMAALAKRIGARSAIVVPLRTREGPFGIAAFGAGGRAFTPDDLAVAEEIGRRASVAVDNARLVAAARRAQGDAERAAHRTARLQALSAALASALTPNDVAEAAVRESVAAVGADAGVLVLIAPDGHTLSVVNATGYDEHLLARWANFDLATPVPLAEAVRVGEPIVVVSADEGALRYPAMNHGTPARYLASISVPLMAEGRSFGALGLSFGRPLSVQPEDQDLLLAVARQCAQAVRRATLFDAEAVARAQAEEAGRRLSFLAEASAVLTSLDYEVTLQRVARLAVPAFADYVAIDLLEEDGGLHRVAFAHVDPRREPLLSEPPPAYPRASGELHPLQEAVATGMAILVPDIDEAWMQRATQSAEHLANVRALGPRSLVIAPLTARGRTLGVMSFVTAESGRRYGPDDRALAAEVARRAAAAVDNARLYRESEAARREAEAASRAKGQFLAVMSHELRTPLNAVLGYTDLVEMGVHGPVTEGQREAMRRIRRSGQHLLSLVNNVLNLERAETGGLETESVSLSVAALFDDADAIARAQAEAKGITLVVERPQPDVTVLGERDKAGQVLVNLLSNAVKFTEAGGRITLSCEGNASHVDLRVADTGVGIPAQALDQVFEPFVQLDTGLTRRVEGAGLGLAISRRLARLMAGDVTVASAVDAGSTFTLSLRRASR